MEREERDLNRMCQKDNMAQEIKSWRRINRWCYLLSTNNWFEQIVLGLIMFNAVWIGVDLDLGDTGVFPEIFWEAVEHFFCGVFTFEILLRIFAHPTLLKNFVCDPKSWQWNYFDSILVTILVLETWVLPFVTTNNFLSGVSSIRCLRVLRICRAFRLMPELSMMVKSMMAAARSVFSTMLLLIGLMYVFAILLTSWATQEDNKTLCSNAAWDPREEVDCVSFDLFFGNVRRSLLTLIQILVFDDTFWIIRAAGHEAWFIGGLLLVFIIIGSFTILNMLVGVICEIVSITTAEEKESVLRQRIRDVFVKIDTDDSGTITRSEFDGSAVESLRKLGIDKGLIENVFDIIDTDASDSLDLDEFIRVIFKLIHPPQSQDVLKLLQKLDRLTGALGIDGAVPAGGKPSVQPPGPGGGTPAGGDTPAKAAGRETPPTKGPPSPPMKTVGPKPAAQQGDNKFAGPTHPWQQA